MALWRYGTVGRVWDSGGGEGHGSAPMSIYGLCLAGWEDLSTWGYDEAQGSLYAQLTRNTSSDDDGPDIWVTPPRFPVIRTSDGLASVIAAATGSALPVVYAAMNAGLEGHDDESSRLLRLPSSH